MIRAGPQAEERRGVVCSLFPSFWVVVHGRS